MRSVEPIENRINGRQRGETGELTKRAQLALRRRGAYLSCTSSKEKTERSEAFTGSISFASFSLLKKNMDVLQLIRGVRSREPLWDRKHKYYHDRTVTMALWDDVACLLGVDCEYFQIKNLKSIINTAHTG